MPPKKQIHVFKPYVPEWLKYVAILATVAPFMLVFAAATIGVPQAMGYYGISASDAGFGTLIFYAVMVAYTPLGNHFFARLPTKAYLWICVVCQLASLYGCYSAKSFGLLLVMRALSGIFISGIVNISLDLLFWKLKSQHSREIGYASFYAMVLCAGVAGSLLGSYSFDEQDLNHFYRLIMFSFLPGAIILTLILNDGRLVPFKLIRVSRMGWADCFLLGVTLILIGYVLAYGQEYNWFDDKRILRAFITFIVSGICTLLRFWYKKHPYLDLKIFRSRNFRFGILLLIILYLIRGAFNITLSYFSQVLDAPFIETNEILTVNILGILAGSAVSTMMLIKKTPIQIIWLSGFVLMLVFYGTMCFRFNPDSSVYDYIPLLIVQGMGQGMLMNPIIVFYVSSVPKSAGSSAAGFGIMTRYLSFSTSIALISYFQLWFSRLHQERINNDLNPANSRYTEYLQHTAASLKLHGVLSDKASGAASAIMHSRLNKEAYMEFAMSYYEWICVLIIFAMLLVMLMPALNRTVINLRNKRPFGAGF